MHILFLHCGQEFSGTARAFAVAARGLAARGHTVRFLAEPESRAEQSVSRMATVASKIAGADLEGKSDVAPFEVVQFRCEGSSMSAGWRLKNLFRRWDADVVFVTTEREHAIASAACWLGRRGAIVRRSPAGCELQMGGAGKFAASQTETVYLFADEKSATNSKIPRRGGKPIVAMPGVDVSRYPERVDSPSPEPAEGVGIRYIICVYDPRSRGRAATAIRTVSMLSPRHPYLRLMIFGAGSDSEELRMQAAALGVLDLVSFLGERDDHLLLMRDADLGWVVAEADTAAYGILDLMALGVPVIAPEGSIAESYVANLITGTLIPPDDPATTAAAVVQLLTNEEQRAAIGAAGRGRVAREFPEAAMVDGFEQAVNAAAGRHR
ncbi:MAG: glycosyltransferase family 4 protein [Gemmatimonadaceae bacterium]